MGAKILVTGRLGFIGSNFIREALRACVWRIVNLDKRTYAGNPPTSGCARPVSVDQADICDPRMSTGR